MWTVKRSPSELLKCLSELKYNHLFGYGFLSIGAFHIIPFETNCQFLYAFVIVRGPSSPTKMGEMCLEIDVALCTFSVAALNIEIHLNSIYPQ